MTSPARGIVGTATPTLTVTALVVRGGVGASSDDATTLGGLGVSVDDTAGTDTGAVTAAGAEAGAAAATAANFDFFRARHSA